MASSSSGSPLASFLSMLSANKTANWGQSALINVLNSLQGAQSYGQDRATGVYDPLRQGSSSSIDRGNYIFGSPTGGALTLQDQIGMALNGITPGQFQQSGLTGHPQAALDGSADNAALNMPGVNSTYSNLMGGNGQVNPQQAQALGTYGDILNGGNGVQQMQTAAYDAMKAGGYDPFGQFAQSMAPGVMGNLGSTAGTAFGVNAAQQLLSQGGLNSQGQQGTQAALLGLLGGGENGTTQALQSIGQGYAGQPALMPTALAAGMAKDQAGAQAKHSAEAFQAQALARGGGAGATVANGAQNAGLADFADQISQAQSSAYQNSMNQQQGLNLQQQGQGAQMALGAANTAAGKLGTYGSLLGNLEGTANQGQGLGLSALGNLQNAQTGLASVYGNLGMQAGQNANSRLNAGGTLANNALNNILGAGQGINGLSATQIQALLGAASGANGSYQGLAGLQIGSGQLGNSQMNNYYNGMNSLYGSQLGVNQLGLNYNGQGLQGYSSLYNPSLNYASTGLSGQSGLFQAYASNALNGSQQAQQQFGKSLGGLDTSSWGNFGTSAVTGS